MQVTIKYLGLVSSRIGKRSEVLVLPAGATFTTLMDLLHKKYYFDTSMPVYYNLNGKGIAENATASLADGDLVMVIPHISGG